MNKEVHHYPNYSDQGQVICSLTDQGEARKPTKTWTLSTRKLKNEEQGSSFFEHCGKEAVGRLEEEFYDQEYLESETDINCIDGKRPVEKGSSTSANSTKPFKQEAKKGIKERCQLFN